MAAGNVPGNVPGTRPPDGKMPLRFIPAGVMAPVLHPSMVFEPLINACGPLWNRKESELIATEFQIFLFYIGFRICSVVLCARSVRTGERPSASLTNSVSWKPMPYTLDFILYITFSMFQYHFYQQYWASCVPH